MNKYYDFNDEFPLVKEPKFKGKFDPLNPPKNCTDYHPPLSITIGTQETKIFGSSCIMPNIEDADLYVSLDDNATFFEWEKPWKKGTQEHLRYFIRDMSVPTDPKDFQMCLDYVIQALSEKKKVHVGCIAGHGRTGLFLSALVQKTMPEKLKELNISAIDYVRSNYCSKAVETFSQILFLNTFYNVEIPKKETPLIQEFYKFFEEDYGVAFNEIIKEGIFMKCLDAIDDLEHEIDELHNPHKYKKQTHNISAKYHKPNKKI